MPPSNPMAAAALKARLEEAKAARTALRESATKARREALIAGLDPLGRLLLELASLPGARCWADSLRRSKACQFESWEARFAFCLWLGAPIAELADRSDPLGREALSRAGANTRRHTALLCSMFASATRDDWSAKAHAEVDGFFGRYDASVPANVRRGDGSHRRMDGVLVAPGAFIMFDPTILDGTLPRGVGAFHMDGGLPNPSPLEEGEAVKVAHYAPVPPGWTFYPCARGVQTESGPGAAAWAAKVALEQARAANDGKQPSARLVDIKRKSIDEQTGCAIMRALVAEIASTLESSPHRVLTKETRWLDPRYSTGKGRGGGGRYPVSR